MKSKMQPPHQERQLQTHGKQHNATLDGLRGVAAAAVVWFHITHRALAVTVPARGYLAVDFFFLLSGFVIAAAYRERLRSELSILAFVQLRLIRLYPLILLGSMLGLGWLLAWHPRAHFLPATVLGLLLIPYSGLTGRDGDFFPLDPALWSLMFELWANFLFAAIGKLRVFLPLCWGAAAIGFVGIMHFGLDGHSLAGGHSFRTFPMGVARVLFAFFAGILLHHLLTATRLSRLPAVSFPVLAAALLGAFCVPSSFGPLYDIFAVAVIFPFLVACGARDCINPRWRQSALLGGELSYPLYLMQVPFVLGFAGLYGRPVWVVLPFAFTAFTAAVATAYISLRWYDRPVRRWLSQRMPRSVAGGGHSLTFSNAKAGFPIKSVPQQVPSEPTRKEA